MQHFSSEPRMLSKTSKDVHDQQLSGVMLALHFSRSQIKGAISLKITLTHLAFSSQYNIHCTKLRPERTYTTLFKLISNRVDLKEAQTIENLDGLSRSIY